MFYCIRIHITTVIADKVHNKAKKNSKKKNTQTTQNTIMTIIWNYLWRQLNNIGLHFRCHAFSRGVSGKTRGAHTTVCCTRSIVHVRLSVLFIWMCSLIYKHGACSVRVPCYYIELFLTHTLTGKPPSSPSVSQARQPTEHIAAYPCVSLIVSCVCARARIRSQMQWPHKRWKLNEHFLTQFCIV